MKDFDKHLYFCIAEECAEVIQAVTKTLRFGEENWSPYDLTCTKNVDNIRNELVDLLAVVEMLNLSVNTFEPKVRGAMTDKQIKVRDLYRENGGVF